MSMVAGAMVRRSLCRIRGRRASLIMLVVVASAAGCDYPTGLPKWNTEWLVPVKNTSLGAAQLVPGTMSQSSDNAAFLVTVSPVTLSRSLGQLCGAGCTAFAGLTVPKPAFTATVGDTLRLPGEVTGATLAGGSLQVTISNGFAFDPLRPGGSSRGTLALNVTSGGASVGRLSLGGDTVALPANGTLTRTIALGTGAISNRLAVELTLTSPAGDPVRIDPNQGFSVTVTAQSVRLSDVTVTISQKMASMQPIGLDLTGIDQSLIDRVQSGSLVLAIVNPFGVAGTMTLTLTSPGMTSIVKTVPLAAGGSNPVVHFTPQEMRSMLGREVALSAAGAVSAGQAVKLTPSQAIQITTELSLILGPKES